MQLQQLRCQDRQQGLQLQLLLPHGFQLLLLRCLQLLHLLPHLRYASLEVSHTVGRLFHCLADKHQIRDIPEIGLPPRETRRL